jgi:hypothetical protein
MLQAFSDLASAPASASAVAAAFRDRKSPVHLAGVTGSWPVLPMRRHGNSAPSPLGVKSATAKLLGILTCSFLSQPSPRRPHHPTMHCHHFGDPRFHFTPAVTTNSHQLSSRLFSISGFSRHTSCLLCFSPVFFLLLRFLLEDKLLDEVRRSSAHSVSPEYCILCSSSFCHQASSSSCLSAILGLPNA